MYELKIPVKLYTDADGNDFLLPTEREIAEEVFRWRSAIAETEDLEEDADADLKKALRRQKKSAQQMLAHYLTLQTSAVTLSALATETEYAITKPSWEEYVDSRADAETLNEEIGAVSLDDVKWMKALLPKCVTLPTETPPCVVLYLWGRLKRSLNPDTSRLPFIVSSVPSG